MTQRAWIPLYCERLLTSPKLRALGNDMATLGAYFRLLMTADRDASSVVCGWIIAGFDRDGRPLPLTHRRFAEVTGIPRKSVSGYVARLSDAGLIVDHGADGMLAVEVTNFRATLQRMRANRNGEDSGDEGGVANSPTSGRTRPKVGGKGGGKGGELAHPPLLAPARAESESESIPTGGAQALPARPKAPKRRAPTEPPTDAAPAGGSLFPEVGPPTKRPNNNPALAAFAEAWEDRYRSPHAWGGRAGKAAGDLGATVHDLGLDLRTEEGLNEWRAVCRAYLDDDGAAAERRHPWAWLPQRAAGLLATLRADRPQQHTGELRRRMEAARATARQAGASQ